MSTQGEHTVRAYSRRFHNLYLFVTEKCQLRCKHCYMGDRLERGTHIQLDAAARTITYFHNLGAEYLTLVGGEPTLHPALVQIVRHAQSAGYKKVMIDTNGLTAKKVIREFDPDDFYYLRVSLDGASAETHDQVRGKGTFARSVAGIRLLVENRFKVRITSTVFNFNAHEVGDLLRLAGDLGVELVNLHSFSEEGFGTEHPDWSMTPYDWMAFCDELVCLAKQARVKVRYPPTWIRRNEMSNLVARGFHGCLGHSLDRVSVMPDGRVYVCSAMFDHPVNFAEMTDTGLVLNSVNASNEYELFTSAVMAAESPEFSGCPADELLGVRPTQSDVVSVCRLWRMEL
jgi:MoaA/NifB/PqqE/SkfB family radical SAM enzyme